MANFRDMEIKDDAERKADIQVADINVPEFLKGAGLTFQSPLGPGKVLATTEDGQEAEVDLHPFITGQLKNKGVDPSTVEYNLQINTPDTAVDQSTLSEGRRAQLALGTFGQKVNKLQEIYGKENVDYRPDSGLLYKEDGAWYKVDAGKAPIEFVNKKGEFDPTINTDFYKQYQDDWRELSRDLADLPDLAINIAATTYGAAKGVAGGVLAGAPLGPAGAFVGGGIGGATGAAMSGAAATGIRSVLGKVAGLGSPDLDELKEEMVIDAMLSAGGQALSWGAKPTLSGVVAGIKALKNGTDNVGKSVISGVLGGYSKAGSDAITRVIDEPGEWGMRMKSLAKESVDSKDLSEKAFNNGTKKMEELFELSDKKLSPMYRKNLDDLIQKSPQSFEMTSDNIGVELNKGLENRGVGQFIRPGEKVVDPILNTEKTISGDKFKFIPYSRDVIRQKSVNAEDAFDMSATTLDMMRKVENEINALPKNMAGKDATYELARVNRYVNRITNDVINSEATRSEKAVASALKQSWDDVKISKFSEMGLQNEYSAMEKQFAEFADPVDFARSALNSKNPDKIASIFKQINSSVGMSQGTKGVKNSLVKLTGKEGEKLANDISWDYVIHKTAPWAPTMGVTNVAGTLATGPVGLAQSSPRIAATEAAMLSKAYKTSGKLIPDGLRDAAKNIWNMPDIQYNLMTLDTLKTLSPIARKDLLQNPVLLRSVLTAPMQSIQEEQDGVNMFNEHIKRSLDEAQ